MRSSLNSRITDGKYRIVRQLDATSPPEIDQLISGPDRGRSNGCPESRLWTVSARSKKIRWAVESYGSLAIVHRLKKKIEAVDGGDRGGPSLEASPLR